jgi:hypothetical protein
LLLVFELNFDHLEKRGFDENKLVICGGGTAKVRVRPDRPTQSCWVPEHHRKDQECGAFLNQ